MKKTILTVIGIILLVVMVLTYCYYRATGEINYDTVPPSKAILIFNAEHSGVVEAVLTNYTPNNYLIFVQGKDTVYPLRVDSALWTIVNIHDTIVSYSIPM